MSQDMTPFVGRPGDFDFLIGRWAVRNRRLQTRLAGAADWIEFPAVLQAWSHLQGLVSVDEIRFETQGYSGCTWRSLDLASGQWAIYWINSRSGRVFPAVRGGWAGARGEFYGEDDDDGRPVVVRFVWERMGADAARWAQAFSNNGGQSWEENWVMEFDRVAQGEDRE